jgi:ATP-dependent RNA helicase DeaD
MLSYILVVQEHFIKRKKIMPTLTNPQEDANTSEITSESKSTVTNEILSSDVPVIAEGFTELGLSENLLKALNDMNFVKPSSIQKEAIPQVLAGNDIIAKAPTGSGKTAAFAVPIIEKLDLNPESKNIQAIVLSPTRELAIQVHKEFEKLTKYYENISVVSIYGGQNIEKQFSALKKKPQIIVATPGRLMDHLRRGSIKLDLVHTVVLDEADEMLDMGFREDIYTILEETPVNRQTILFSATMAKDILAIATKFQKSPNIVDVTDNLLNTPDIEQQYFEVSEHDKIELIARLLNLHNINLALVFCNTKSNVDKVVENLKSKGFASEGMHGDMNQAQREKVMRGFRSGIVKILVATDVAGRGIDVKNVEAVFNYDLPRDDEDYIHRIGRTGRAGTSGISFTFISKSQASRLKRIERANGMQIHKTSIPTFEEIQNASVSSFKDKIKSIINDEDLTQYKANIEELVNEGSEVIDIASALLKFYMSKEGKKINKDVVFEDPQDKPSERHGRRGNRSRDRRRKFEDKDRNKVKDDFKSNKNSKKKHDEKITIDDIIMPVRENGENKSRKRNSSNKFSNKSKEVKFFGKFNKKSKSRSKR